MLPIPVVFKYKAPKPTATLDQRIAFGHNKRNWPLIEGAYWGIEIQKEEAARKDKTLNAIPAQAQTRTLGLPSYERLVYKALGPYRDLQPILT